MKAILRNRIFLQVDKKLRESIMKRLTYKIPIRISAVETKIIDHYDYRLINTNTISIPIGRTDLIPKTHEVIDKRIYALEDFYIRAGIELRPSQQFIYDNTSDNTIINAGCSFGKTFTALALIERLAQKTLVIVHTKKLMTQWEDEIKKVLGITPSIIGGGNYSTDSQIVLGMTRSLQSKESPKLYNMFGTVIMDECHHIAAATFNSIIDKYRARYKIGLSATLKRKDEKHFLITNYITHSNIQKPPLENSLKPEIVIINTGIQIPDDPVWANRVNMLMDNENYINNVIDIIKQTVAKGHVVLAVANRVGVLEELSTKIDKSILAVGGLDNDKEIRAGLASKKINVILGSTQVMSEGVSYNEISALIPITPIASTITLEQLIGRAIRKLDGKLTPVIFDMKMSGTTGVNQHRSRMGHYAKMKYKINTL